MTSVTPSYVQPCITELSKTIASIKQLCSAFSCQHPSAYVPKVNAAAQQQQQCTCGTATTQTPPAVHQADLTRQTHSAVLPGVTNHSLSMWPHWLVCPSPTTSSAIICIIAITTRTYQALAITSTCNQHVKQITEPVSCFGHLKPSASAVTQQYDKSKLRSCSLIS